MSVGALFIVTPTVGWAVPLLWPAILAAAGALGYKHMTDSMAQASLQKQQEGAVKGRRTVELSLDVEITGAVTEDLKRDQILTFSRDDIVVTVQRDLRGKCTIRVNGPDGQSVRQLEAKGKEFLGAIIQQFAYNKMAQEMERRGANVVGEEISAEGDIVLKLRRWD